MENQTPHRKECKIYSNYTEPGSLTQYCSGGKIPFFLIDFCAVCISVPRSERTDNTPYKNILINVFFLWLTAEAIFACRPIANMDFIIANHLSVTRLSLPKLIDNLKGNYHYLIISRGSQLLSITYDGN